MDCGRVGDVLNVRNHEEEDVNKNIGVLIIKVIGITLMDKGIGNIEARNLIYVTVKMTIGDVGVNF